MKKIQQFAMMAVIAATGSVGFTACSSSSDEMVANNPNYNPLTNEVVTKFSFNVSTGNTPTTRMTSAATQASETEIFRGIDNTIIYAYKNGSDGKHIAAAAKMEKAFDLSTILARGEVDKDNSHRVIETSMPLNTNTLLFYGKAIQGNAYGMNFSAYDEFGHLDAYTLPEEGELDLNDVTFEAGRRLTGENQTNYHKIEDLLAGVLTVVMNTNLAGSNHVKINATDRPADGVAAYGFDVAVGDYPNTLKWADYANVDGKSPVDASHDLQPLEVKLANVYSEMTNISEGTGELRSGSGRAVQLIFHDLWTNINEVRCATPLSEHEAIAKFMATQINKNLEKFLTYTYMSNDGHGLEGVDYQPIATIAENLNLSEWPTNAVHTTFSDIAGVTDLTSFPWDFNIPFGATHLRFDKTKEQFFYVQDYNTSLMGDNVTVTSADPITVEDYCYPAELLYFGNSPVRVSNVEKGPNEYPNGVGNWDDDNMWPSAEWSVGHVTSATQSVAMKNDINYGTALLKTTVRFGAVELKDNNHAIQKKKNPTIADTDEPDQTISVTDDAFQLTGIIIGGMPKRVGWNYIAKDGAKYKAYFYDRAIVDPQVPAATTSVPNYTLVFDNYKNAEAQDKIYVALEFMNNSGKDFFGEHNMIRHNTHFYLIGELDPDKGGLNAIEWPTHHPLPPYNADGSSIKTPRVFMQDYMTTADFVIGENSLKHALLTVPDLRYSSLTLGLSVDLKWSTGLNFGNILLGGE
jgi:hypothetical protein